MRDDVYEFLRYFGFTQEDCEYFEHENEKVFFLTLEKLLKNIAFLYSKGLSKEEIIYVCRKDPFMITSGDNRLDALDKVYYEELIFSKEELHQLFINNPEIYTQSPVQQQYIIDYLKSKGYSRVVIKHWLLENHEILNMTFEEFKDYETASDSLIDIDFVNRYHIDDDQIPAPSPFLSINELSKRLECKKLVAKLKEFKTALELGFSYSSDGLNKLSDEVFLFLLTEENIEPSEFIISDSV